MKIKTLLILSSAILLLGLFLRTANLNILPVFADESIYIRWSQVMRAESTLRFLPLSDGKQPLFMWLTIPFLKYIADPLIAGRMVSVLAGLGTAAGTGLAAYLLFKNPRLGLAAGLIWMVIPYAVFFDRLALADSLLTMFMVWIFVFAFISLKYLRWDFSMLAGFSLGFAWLTKSPAVFSLALIPALLLFVPWSRLSGARKLLPLGYLLTAFFIGFGMYNILRLGPEFHMIAIRNADYLHPLSEVIRHPLDPLTSHLRDAFDFFFRLMTPLGLGFAFLGLSEAMGRHVKARLVLLAWWLGPVFAQAFIARSFTARYLLFTLPFAVILAAHGIWHLGDRTRRHFLSAAGLVLFLITCLGFDYQLLTAPASAPLPRIERSGYLEEWTAGFGIREVSGAIAGSAGSGPVVVGSEGFFGTPFSALEMYLNGLSDVRIVGLGSAIGSPDPKLVSARRDNQVFVVANSTRVRGDPDSLGYDVIAAYPKARRPDGTTEYLLFMKLK